MSAAKTLKEEGPTLAGISVSAILLAFVGALLGFLYLASVPPTSFKSVADLNAYLEKTPEPKLLDVSYFEGPVSRSRSWEQKREILLNGSANTVELTAGEINAWMSAKFRKPSAASAAEDEDWYCNSARGTELFYRCLRRSFFQLADRSLDLWQYT